MPDFSSRDVTVAREELLDGMRRYKDAAGDDCGYTDADVEACAAVVDAYLSDVAAQPKWSPKAVGDAVRKAVLNLNALNQRGGGSLIETDQRETLCELILVAAKAAGLETDDDVTEAWREW